MTISTEKLTVSVGIPAYNEEANIGRLILGLLSQSNNHYELKEILVFSDGSDDGTNSIVTGLSEKFPKVKLFKVENRIGQQEIQNLIVEKYSGDLLAIIEADTLPETKNVLDDLVYTFIVQNDEKLGMVVGDFEPVKSLTFFEKIMNQGIHIKKGIFRDFNGGDNVYGCGGHSGKLLSKDFLTKFKWPTDVPEDAYTYFKLKELGFKFIKNYEARFLIRNVKNHSDRIKQLNKFLGGRVSLCKYFDPDLIKREYKLPLTTIIKHLFFSFIFHPILTLSYATDFMFNRIFIVKKTLVYDPIHEIYKSSKSL